MVAYTNPPGRPFGEGRDLRAFHNPGKGSILARGMCVLALALISVSLVLALLGTARIVGLDFPLAGVSEALVDGLFASRKPRNPVGWFFLADACIGGLQSVAGAYAVYGLVVDPGSPGRPQRVVREDVPDNRADLRVRPAAPVLPQR